MEEWRKLFFFMGIDPLEWASVRTFEITAGAPSRPSSRVGSLLRIRGGDAPLRVRTSGSWSSRPPGPRHSAPDGIAVEGCDQADIDIDIPTVDFAA